MTIVNGTPIKDFYIVLQGESAPTRFRKVELLNLEGCMTSTDANYKSYFVKSDPTQCAGTSIKASQDKARGVFSLSGNRIQGTSEILQVEVYDLKGTKVLTLKGAGQTFMELNNMTPGLYNLRVQTRKGSAQAVYAKM